MVRKWIISKIKYNIYIKILELSTKLTMLALLLSIILIIVSIIFFNHYSLTLMLLVLLSGSLSLIICVNI